MTNLFKVDGQTLTPIEVYPAVSDTINYLTFAFMFSYDWDVLVKSAVFTKGASEYEVVLVNDAITADRHVNLSAGDWTLSVVGSTVVDAVVTKRITTTPYTFTVAQSDAVDGEEFPPSIASQVYVNVNQATPQTFVGGIPKLAADRVIADDNEIVDKKHVADVVATVTADDFNHNDLANKQGGTTNEYYHVTAAEKTVIENTSGTNTGDQDVSGAISTHNTDAGAHAGLFGNLQSISQYDGNSIALGGDSLTALQFALPVSNEYVYYSGFFNVGNALLNQRLKLVGVFATSGYTTTNFIEAGYVEGIIAKHPSMAMILLGTNDVADNKTASWIMSNLQAIYSSLINSGIRVIATTIPPNDNSSSAQKAVRATLNSMIKNYVFNNQYIYLFDLARYVSDNTGDAYASGFTAEGVHMTNLAGHSAGYGFYMLMKDIASDRNTLPCSSNDASNLLTNAMFTSGTTLATGYSIYGALSTELVARTDGEPSRWQKITVDGAQEAFFKQTVMSGYAIGQTIQAITEYSLPSSGFVTDITLRITFTDSATKAFQLYQAIPTGGKSGILKTPSVTIPSGTTSIVFTIICNGTNGTYALFARPKVEIVS